MPLFDGGRAACHRKSELYDIIDVPDRIEIGAVTGTLVFGLHLAKP
jgi:hypothetical protein